MEDNQASNLVNMAFLDDNLVEKRKGQKMYDGMNIIPQPITHMDTYMPYNSDTDIFIRATDTEFYGNQIKLADINGRMNGVNFMGKYYFVDGYKFRVYGRMGQTASTYERIIGTPVDANYLWQIIDPPAGYTPLDTTHQQGVRVYNYDSKFIWYEPCENELKDTSKGANVLPQSPKYIVLHEGRLFLSGSDRDDDNVFITDIQNPYYTPVYLPIQMPPNSDKVRGLVVYDDSVVVGREHDLHVITGNTNNSSLGGELFTLRKLNTHTGFMNQESVDVAHNYLFFFGSDGNAYALTATRMDEKVMATMILSQTIDLRLAPLSIEPSHLITSVSTFHNDMWYLSIHDKVLVYSYRLRAWTVYTGLNARSFYVKDGTLLWGNDGGDTVQFSDDHLDFGVPYRAFWTSKMFDMDNPNSYKQYREFFLVAHTFDNYNSDIRVTFEIDYVDVNERVIIKNQISRWGISTFGDRFITRNTNASLPFVIGRRGRQIRVTVSNGYDVSGTVATPADLEAITDKVEELTYFVTSENAHYVYRDYAWLKLESMDMNQPMRVYQINGDYELRGKR